MASNAFLNIRAIFPLILALYLCTSSALAIEDSGYRLDCASPSPSPSSPPTRTMIHITNAIHHHKNTPQIHIIIEAGEGVFAPEMETNLSPGEKYQMRADEENVVYNVMAIYGLKFTAVNVYEPERDKGRAAVYWRVNNWGFWFSHDNHHWKKVAPRETE